MQTPAFILAAVAVALAVALLVYRQFVVWTRRRSAWAAVAPELGLALQPGVDLAARFASLEYFNRGHRRVTPVALGGAVAGASVVLGDYQFTTGGGKSQTVHRHTVCVFFGGNLSLPRFALRREHGVVDRIAQALGMQDIDFAEDREFSRAFVLKGEDETRVRAFFHLERRQRLLQRLPSRVHLEGGGDTLLVHTGTLVAPTEAREFLQRATDVLDDFRR